MKRKIERILRNFDAPGTVVDVQSGPVVATYLVELGADTRVSKLERLADDIALRLGVDHARIVPNVPGAPYSGVEIPRHDREVVPWTWYPTDATLPLQLGVDTLGNPVVCDLARAPHLLVAGATGSGKSVTVHAMICGMLTRHSERDLRLVLIDPKRLEFASYARLPHLLGGRVVTDSTDAVDALERLCDGMESRYELLEQSGCRDIASYRARGGHMPYVVVVIDEWADLYYAQKKAAESPLVRLAQKARAAGIHIVLATQRPSAKVVTGLIKANFPARMALRVGSMVDSRVILDCNGAEQLLGRGDSLVSGFGRTKPFRVHGAYCNPDEILNKINPAYVQRVH